MDTQSSNPSVNSGTLPTLPSRAELKFADTPQVSKPQDSLDDLALLIANSALLEIQKFVARGNPLNDPAMSSWLWLRADGSIDVVYDTDRDNRRLKGETKSSLFLEAFKCFHDTTPNSRFHGWVADKDGAFIGDLTTQTAVTTPLWDRRPSRGLETNKLLDNVAEALGLEPFRLDPFSTEEVQQVLADPGYLQFLKDRILSWLIRGDYLFTVERLSVQGITSAVRTHGNRFAYAVGRKKLYAALGSKVKTTLYMRGSETRT